MPALLDLRRTVAAMVAVAMSAALIAFAFIISDSFTTQMTSTARLSIGGADAVVQVGRTGELDNALVARIKDLPGVASARGEHWDVLQVDLPAGDVDLVSRDVPTIGGRTSLVAGRLPTGLGEVAISTRLAQMQALHVGDTVRLRNGYDADVRTSPTVVGIVQAGPESGSLDEATQGVVYAVPEQLAAMGARTTYYNVYVTFHNGADPSAVLTEVSQAVETAQPGAVVSTADQVVEERAMAASTGATMIMTIIGLLAPVCAVVAAIVIATTFTTLIARQTHMIGLLRCVGASRGQVMRSVLRTATLTGLAGSVAGAALGAGVAAAVVHSGLIDGLGGEYLTITPVSMLASISLATLVALVAVLLPARRASRVSPLIAVTGRVAQARRGGHGRLWSAACGGLLLAGGITALVLGGGADQGGYGAAVGGSGLVMAGVLLILPLAVSVLMNLVARTGSEERLPVLRLAARNLARNRGRSTAVAATLFLCMTVGSALLVGLFSANDSSERMTAETNPVDMAIFGVTPATDTAALTAAVEAVDGVEGTAYVPGLEVTAAVGGGSQSVSLNIIDPAQVAGVLRSTSGLQDLKDGVLIVGENQHVPDGARVTLTGPAGSVEVTAHLSKAGWAPAVTPATAQRLSNGAVAGAVMWVRAAGDGTSPVVAQAVTEALRGQGLMVKDYSSVSADFLTTMRQVELVIFLIMVAALVVCLIGLANTVDVSVLERTREIGLLRATGSSQAGVRQLIVNEAVLLALAGGLLGVVTGTGIGAAGSLAVLGSVGLTVSLPVPALVGVVVMTVLIGVVASVRPAGRAAAVPPVLALAQE